MKILYAIPERRPNDLSQAIEKVKEIISNVKAKGDQALYYYEELFDGVRLKSIRVSKDELEERAKILQKDAKEAIDTVYQNLYEFYLNMMPKNVIVERKGVYSGVIWRPIDSVGIYVPGGKHYYPSSLLMAGVPAKVAGVKHLYVTTPPTRDSLVEPSVAYISLKLNVDEVYLLGGAQAIAALAYGTETVRKVNKIVGPGSVFVQAAKLLVRNVVEIDGIEGPTELVIIADEFSKPEEIFYDLVAQGEHGKDTLLVLITTSENVAQGVSRLAESYPSENTIYVVKVNTITEAINIANHIAPEHLSLYIRDAERYLELVNNTGAVSLGSTPPAIIDYGIGPNHILPTNRWAMVRGGLTVYDFLKPIMFAKTDNLIDTKLLDSFTTLANYEGFVFHAKSIGDRYVIRDNR